jgi:CRP-like cAMP-binding protein
MYVSFKGLLYFHDLQEKVNFLLRVSIFEDIDALSIEKLIIVSEMVTLNKGCSLYEENTPAKYIYVVFYGSF